MPSRSFVCLLAGSSVVMLAACSDATAPDEKLNAARRRWAQQGPASYSMVVHRSCECTPEGAGPVLVRVRNGAVESRQYTATGASVPASLADVFPSVEGLFQLIEDARRQRPNSLEVRYDATLGYPTLISVDFDRMIADDEFVYTASELRPAATIAGALTSR